MLTMRRTVADDVRMCAGAFTSSRIGPTVTPWPPVIFSTLNRMFAASSLGNTSTLALPVKTESGISVLRTSSPSAALPCMREAITAGRPIRIGLASFSSSPICTARNTRSSSPSA
jgi:hypothetical protein